jgi:diguanylate cyclase (GGDEF)-like protein
MLHHVTDCVAELLDAERVSLRLVDEGRTRLLVAARTGAPLHADGATEWTLGEGLAGWVARERTALRVDDAEADPRFVRKPGMEGRMGSFLGVPILDADGSIGVLATTSRWRAAFSETHEKWLRLVAGIAGPYLDVARLQRLALTDALTCVWNRHALDGVLCDSFSADEPPTSLLLIDLDHFKRVNDEFGHPVGDDVLRAVTQCISESLRRGDQILRMGGEEFLVVLPGVPLAAAAAIAERMRRSASEREIVPGVSLTLSIGVVARRHAEGRAQALARLDAALYKAKREGRDRIAVEESFAEP